MRGMLVPLVLAALLPAGAAGAQDATAIVSGDAVQGLVSRMDKSEIHVLADPALNRRRLVLRIVVLNRGTVPAPFGPSDVTVTTAAGAAVPLVPRDRIIAEQTGHGGGAAYESSTAHAAAALPTSGAAGQMDVTGYSGSMGGGVAGVPAATLDRAQQRSGDADKAARLDAVLLKPVTIAPGSADGGQVVTEPLKRSDTRTVTVAVTFAGETHRFAVTLPR